MAGKEYTGKKKFKNLGKFAKYAMEEEKKKNKGKKKQQEAGMAGKGKGQPALKWGDTKGKEKWLKMLDEEIEGQNPKKK